MAKKNTSFILRAAAAALILVGVWLLHKPVVAVVWLFKTGDLPVLVLKRGGWIWFETSVKPWTMGGFKSWAAYALAFIAGVGAWTIALGVFSEAAISRYVFKALLYCLYILFAAVAVLMLIDLGRL